MVGEVTTSIIIPVYNQPEYTIECIKSIRETATASHEIIVIDNGSKPPFEKNKRIKDVHVLTNEKNLGFPRAVNQGLYLACGKYILILNNDIIMTPKWDAYMQYHINMGNLDMVGPCTNLISGPQQTYVPIYENKKTLFERAETFHLENAGIFQKYPRIVGFCMMAKRELFDAVGSFDEQFSPGNFEDDDYCLRAIEKGYKVGFAKDVFIHHFGGITHKSMNVDYQEIIRKNKKLFDEKWPPHKVRDLVEQAVK